MPSSGGQSQPTEQRVVSETKIPASFEPFFTRGFKKAEEASKLVPTTPYPGPLVAPVAEASLQSLNIQKNIADALQGGGNSNFDVFNKLKEISEQPVDVFGSEPYRATAEAVARPTFENLADIVLPGIQGRFVSENPDARGGRLARSENLAIGETADSIANALAGIALPEAQRQEGQALNALIQSPSFFARGVQEGLLPAELLSQAGSFERSLEQEKIQEALARYQEEIQAPFRAVNPYLNLIGGIDIGSTTVGTTTSTSPSSNLGPLLGGGLAGGLALQGLTAAFPETLGAIGIGSSPAAAAGALGGISPFSAGLPIGLLLSGLLS